MILLSGHSLTPSRKVPVEAFSVTLTERDSTATLTPADMTGIGVNSWLKDDDGIVWRVRSISENYSTKTPQVQLEHVVSALNDRILFGEIKAPQITGTVGATTCTARQAITYALNQQSDFVLGTFDYENVSNPYKFDGNTLFDAIEYVSNSLSDSMWTYDLTTYPFKLNIISKPSTVASELRPGRNLVTISKTIDKSGMYTRFYPIGKDDLHVSGDYVSQNEDTYGIIAKVEVDQSLETAAELTAWANERLDKHAEPVVTITVDALELADATGESLDRLKLGWKCRIPLTEFGTIITETITKIVYKDKVHAPEVAQITLANNKTDVTRIIADMIKNAGGGGRGSARQQKEDHAWFEDTNDHVAMVAEGIVGVDAHGNPNWVRLSQIIVGQNGIDAQVQNIQGYSDEHQSILSQSGMHLDEHGVLVYAEDNVNMVGSKLSVLSDSISSEVTRATTAEGSMSSRITQNADAISAEVTRASTAEGTLSGQITVEAGKISQIVSAVGADGQVTAASIALAINSSGSGAYITADHIYISGNTRINEVFTVISNAVGVTVPMVCSSDLTINSNGDLNVYDINLAGSNPITLNATSMAKAIKEAKVEGSGANMTLTLIAFDGSEVNFTKAATTSLSETWSGGTITVEAQPSGVTLQRTLAAGTVSWSGDTATVPVNATWGSGTTYTESTGWNVYVDAGGRYSAGYADGYPSGTITIGSKVTGTVYNVSISPTSGSALATTKDFSSIYSDARVGYTQGTFTLANVTLQGTSAGLCYPALTSGGTVYYTAGSTYSYYKGNGTRLAQVTRYQDGGQALVYDKASAATYYRGNGTRYSQETRYTGSSQTFNKAVQGWLELYMHVPGAYVSVGAGYWYTSNQNVESGTIYARGDSQSVLVQNNSGAYYLRGDSVSVEAATNGHYVNLRGTAETSYVASNSGGFYLRGDSVTGTNQGTTSIRVGSSATKYNAGSTVTNTYYTKS